MTVILAEYDECKHEKQYLYKLSCICLNCGQYVRNYLAGATIVWDDETDKCWTQQDIVYVLTAILCKMRAEQDDRF